MMKWYHLLMAKRKPDTEPVRLTYDELEAVLTALALRQEELRDSRSSSRVAELELIWYASDKMDVAQRSLESRMTEQLEGWLKSLDQEDEPEQPVSDTQQTRESMMTKLSRLLRL